MKTSFVRKVFHIAFIFLLLTCADFSISAEGFRVKKTVVLSMSANESQDSQSQISAGINDGIAIVLPKDLTFVQGIELTVKIPNAVAQCPNTIIYSLYENISPFPQEKTIDYTGKELYTGAYPGQISLTIQIPLVRGNTIKKTPYADKTLIPEHSRGFIFLRNQLAMKGLPQSVYSSEFTISAKPIYMEKGRLIVKADNVKPEDITVTVDDTEVTESEAGGYFLKPGVHKVSITANSFRNENRSVLIEKAKDSVLSLNFQSTEPVLSINMPQGTHVSVDSQNVEVKNNSIMIEPGEHILKFSLGGYEIVKSITVQEGRNYSITVFLDADVKEE